MTPYSRVLKNLRICMYYPKFCIFFIQIDIFCLLFKVILTRVLNFLTDNQYGPCISRVLICNINTPLSGAQKTDIVDFLQSYLLNFQKVNCPNTPDQPTAKYQERKKKSSSIILVYIIIVKTEWNTFTCRFIYASSASVFIKLAVVDVQMVAECISLNHFKIIFLII